MPSECKLRNFYQLLDLFRQYERSGDYAEAARVTRQWAAEQGKRHEIWTINMALLLFALKLGLYSEAQACVSILQTIDPDDPGLLGLMASIAYSRGDQTQAVEKARLAYQYALADDDPSLHLYEDDLRKLEQGQAPFYTPCFKE